MSRALAFSPLAMPFYSTASVAFEVFGSVSLFEVVVECVCGSSWRCPGVDGGIREEVGFDGKSSKKFG